MAVETNLEREFKFDVDPGFDPPDLRALVDRTERLPEQHLTTTYFDTPDLRLWARGITLRHRVEAGEGAAVATELGKWTLKVPEPTEETAGASTRSELTWKGVPAEIPAEATAIVAGLVRRAPLQPVVVLSTERRRLLLHAGGDSPWAEIDDDLVTVASGGREGLRFRQLEIELLDRHAAPTEQALVEGVLAALHRAGAAPGGASKFALAAGLDTAGPDTAGSKHPDLRRVVSRIIERDLDKLLEWDYRLRIPDAATNGEGLDVEAVHGARIAARRLRSDLRALRGVFDPVWLGHCRADLEWVGGLLGRLRDEDVLVERVRSQPGEEDREAIEELVTLIRSDRHLGAAELGDALASDRYQDLLDRLHAATQAPPLTDPSPQTDVAKMLDAILMSSWKKTRREIKRLAREPEYGALHKVRIRAKRLRYAAEAVEPFLGQKAHRTATRAKALQSVLGDVNDAVNAQRSLRDLATHPAATPVVAFVAGCIAGRAEGEAARLRRDWRKAAKPLTRRKPVGGPG